MALVKIFWLGVLIGSYIGFLISLLVRFTISLIRDFKGVNK
jgi:hypothetical protein